MKIKWIKKFLGLTENPREAELKYLKDQGLQIGENLRNHSDYAFDSLFPWLIDILNNKVKFNMYFSDFIQRDWMEIDTATADELEFFCEKHNSLIVKTVGGGQGHGILIWNKDDITSRKVNLHDYSGYIAEEIFV